MPKQLRVERCRHDRKRRSRRASALDALGRVAQDAGEMVRMICGGRAGGRRVVALFTAEVDPASGHTPQPQAVGPADLVELEVPLVARISLRARPHLARGTRIADERIQILGGGAPFRRCDAVGDVGRPLTGGGNVVHIGVPERCPRTHEMCVDEEVAIARRGEMLVGSGAI